MSLYSQLDLMIGHMIRPNSHMPLYKANNILLLFLQLKQEHNIVFVEMSIYPHKHKKTSLHKVWPRQVDMYNTAPMHDVQITINK